MILTAETTVRAETALDTRAFRQALGHFPTGVCVVTSLVADAALGMTVNSFNSLSLDPPLVLFSIDGRAQSLPQWERARGYAVNVLAENQKDVADRFARSRSKKWEGMSYSAGFLDAPVLPGVAAVLECAAWARHEGGDHVLFIAEVKRFRTFPDRRPLVFSRGRYAELHQIEFTGSLWPLEPLFAHSGRQVPR